MNFWVVPSTTISSGDVNIFFFFNLLIFMICDKQPFLFSYLR